MFSIKRLMALVLLSSTLTSSAFGMLSRLGIRRLSQLGASSIGKTTSISSLQGSFLLSLKSSSKTKSLSFSTQSSQGNNSNHERGSSFAWGAIGCLIPTLLLIGENEQKKEYENQLKAHENQLEKERKKNVDTLKAATECYVGLIKAGRLTKAHMDIKDADNENPFFLIMDSLRSFRGMSCQVGTLEKQIYDAVEERLKNFNGDHDAIHPRILTYLLRHAPYGLLDTSYLTGLETDTPSSASSPALDLVFAASRNITNMHGQGLLNVIKSFRNKESSSLNWQMACHLAVALKNNPNNKFSEEEKKGIFVLANNMEYPPQQAAAVAGPVSAH